ncbi:MAG: FAD:protein FMN transferase, partial [Propionibacterium sp.]|nr:FAD:protein FMN transferase [Propionibacterium sp.]
MITLIATDIRHVFETMGTVVSVVSPTGRLTGLVRDDLVQAFDRLDRRFSLYRSDSEATAVADHRLLLRDASSEYRHAYDLAIGWTADTDGAFTPHRPDGRIDLAGVVKALGIRDAARVLAAQADDWCINAGGDVLVSGEERPGKPWVVGIVDPDDRSRLASQFTCSTQFPAVATSGIAER